MKKHCRYLLSISIPVLLFGSQLFAVHSTRVDWIRVYNRPGLDEAVECAVDTSGYFYIVGGSATDNTFMNYTWTVSKCSTSNGDTVWTRRYMPTATGMYIAMGCAVDNAGHLFVTGMRQAGLSLYILTIKYNTATGDTIWTRTFPGSGSGIYQGNDCRLDGNGNLYVAGVAGTGASSDYLLLKYSAATGDTVWTRQYDGIGHGRDEAYGCAPDGSGNIYLSGYSFTGSTYKIATVKYATDGDTLWTRMSADSLDSLRYPHMGNAVDRDGNLYVAGMCGVELNSGNRYGVLIKYNPSGTVQWTYHLDGPTVYDAFNACATDTFGNVFAVGIGYNGSNDDGFGVRFNAATGDSVGGFRYNGSLNKSDMCLGVAADKDGNCYAVGMTNAFDSADIVAVKFTPRTTGVYRSIPSASADASLFNVNYRSLDSKAVIRYKLSSAAQVRVNIFDQQGRLVAALVNRAVSAGTHETVWDAARVPAGVYLCRMSSSSGIERTGKIVVGK